MARSKCKNVNCDAAMRSEFIEIPQDGKCPDCGKPMQPEGASANSATDMARKKRMQTLIIGGAVTLVILVGGGLAWLLMGNNSSSVNVPDENAISMSEMIDAKSLPASPPSVETPPTLPVEPVEKVVPVAPVPTTTSLDSQEHIKQAMMYVTLAKANPTTSTENIKNALAEFDVAVKQEETQGHCFAKAYMNRGLAYWLDKKLNLAEKDLVKASECDAKDPIIFYNLASYYSATNKADLALDPLNKALDLGFKDCDILRKDSDLNNLRKMPEFKRALEQHSLFCLK